MWRRSSENDHRTVPAISEIATRLEHEIDHAVDEADNPSEHRGRRTTPNGQFDNEEEKRVILGSELKTATANGEATRNNHNGSPYKVSSPISIF